MFREQNDIRAKYEKVLCKQRERIDQPIIIRDIKCHAIYQYQSFGESGYQYNRYSEYQPLERLVDHIESLMAITNTFHEEKYCETIDGDVRIKAECRNHITRMILSEFSLYTQKPLTEDELNILIHAIHTISAKFNDNVHVVLSSLPVAINKGVILNTTLYVQCGETPKVEMIAKVNASGSDVMYEGHHLFYQVTDAKDSRKFQSDFVAKKDGKFVVNRCLFPITTAGGAKYLQAIDVCIDHDEKVAKHALQRLVERSVLKESEYIPNQIDHILTSNTTEVINKSSIVENIVHVDPLFTPREKRLPESTTVSEEQLRACMKNKYTELKVIKTDECFYVTSPCFGEPYKIVLCNERPLSTYQNKMRELVDQRNADSVDVVKMHL